MSLKSDLVQLINEHGIFAVANLLQKITTEEADHVCSPNDLKDRGPLSILNYEILSGHLSGALDEMEELTKG